MLASPGSGVAAKGNTSVSEPKIYGVAYSRSIGNIWTCLELGIDYENVPIGWDDDSINSDAYRAINPNARVPALRDGDFVMWESLAINWYLVRKHGGPLAPADLHEEAHALQWTLWAALHLERPGVQWAFHTYVNEPHERDPAVAAKAWGELTPLLGVLEGQLAKGPYLLGDRFTVADLNVGCTVFRARRRWDLTPWPRLEAWDEAVFGRPAARRAWEIRAEAAA